MSTDTMVVDLQETSISSSSEIMETNSSSSSWASTGVSTSSEVTSTAYDNELLVSHLTSAIPCVTGDDIVVGSHRFTFIHYPRREGLGVGKYLVSDTFTAGGYDWAITLYPSGRKDKYKGYISIYIRLESDATDVNALFELILVDQSGKDKHVTRTCFGGLQERQPFLMSRRRSQWGFGQYTKKRYLKKSGYLTDNCLVVNCKVGVLKVRTEKNILDHISFIYNQFSSSIDDQNIEVAGIDDQNIEVVGVDDQDIEVVGSQGMRNPLQLQGLINDRDSNKFDQYLYAVDEIQQSIKSGMICGYETQGARAMKTLQLVFKKILNCSIRTTKSNALGSTVYSSSITSSYDYELQGRNHTDHGELSSEQVYRLQSIAKRLHSTGCLGDCIDVYRISRKSAVDARFLRFGIRKWTINDLQSLGCEEFTAKIRIWILAAYKCYNTIFPGEKQYYEQILDGLGAVTYDSCFLAIVKHAAIELNNFADAVSSVASFQKLFAILDLYKVLVVILPEIQSMFHTVAVTNICHGASNTVNSLATLVRKLFSSFEDNVLNERSTTPAPEGTNHSLTEYAMKYVASISQYKELLTDIIVSCPTKSLRNQADERFLEALHGSPLKLHVIWIMISLKINLKDKSRFYKDSLLRYVFIMNNVNYIIRTVEGSPELLEMIGREYVSMLSENVVLTEEDYLSSVGDRLLYCLRDNGLNYRLPFFNWISKTSLKKRFKTFNTTVEEVCRTRSFVVDMQLAGQFDKLMLGKLLPAYKSFLEKYGIHIQGKRYKERYIKYSSEDLEGEIRKIVYGTETIHDVVVVDSGINTEYFVL